MDPNSPPPPPSPPKNESSVTVFTAGTAVDLPDASSDNIEQIRQGVEDTNIFLHIPKRIDSEVDGQLGRATEIAVNHLPLDLDELFTKTIYQSHVFFTPNEPKTILRPALEKFIAWNYPNVQFAFDGQKNMYTTKKIESKCGEILLTNVINNQLMDIKVSIVERKQIRMDVIKEYFSNGSSNFHPYEAFLMLETLLKNRPISLGLTNVGSSFFPVLRNIPINLGQGLELWSGFFLSIIAGWIPYLNIDLTHDLFLKHQSLVSYISSELGCNLDSKINSGSFKTLRKYIKGYNIDFFIPNQPFTKNKYKVCDVVKTAETYYLEKGVTRTSNEESLNNLVQHFEKKLHINLQYPNLPCIHVRDENKKIPIPLEFCHVAKEQWQSKKLTEKQTAIVVRNTHQPPAERKLAIENVIRNVNYCVDPVLKEFGVIVNEQFATIPARVLDQPTLVYAQNKEIIPRNGVWTSDKLFEPVKLKKWALLNMDQFCDRDFIKSFETRLINCGHSLDVTVNEMLSSHNFFVHKNWTSNKIQIELTNFFKMAKKCGIKLIVVVIPDKPADVYAIVKQSAELTIGILTQCIKSETIMNMNPLITRNILLKINTKMNGVNYILKNSSTTIMGSMIIGGHISHASSSQTTNPSIAAVTASYDIHGLKYNMEVQLQTPGVETIEELEDIVYNQLVMFKNMTKTLPQKIIYFRDGGSDGRILKLLHDELIAIRKACLNMDADYIPLVTFLLVQTQHKTKLFPMHNIDKDGMFCNVPPGTIVDTHITHPTELEFYLCSDTSNIQDTTKPTKYHLLWDDSSFTKDQLQVLTFHLCFAFMCHTSSIPYPAPTYYAHLAVNRALAYIKNKKISQKELDKKKRKISLNSPLALENPMFFI